MHYSTSNWTIADLPFRRRDRMQPELGVAPPSIIAKGKWIIRNLPFRLKPPPASPKFSSRTSNPLKNQTLFLTSSGPHSTTNYRASASIHRALDLPEYSATKPNVWCLQLQLWFSTNLCWRAGIASQSWIQWSLRAYRLGWSYGYGLA